MVTVELSNPINTLNGTTSSVYIGGVVNNQSAKTVTVTIVTQKSPYSDEVVVLWSGDVYDQMSGYTELNIVDSVRDYYQNDRNIVEPAYFINSEANWPAFNLAISMDSIMIQYEAAANQVHPSIVSKKDLAYSIIQDKGLDNFAAIFPIFCQIANVAQQHRDDWADLALQYDLPAEFVTIVRGY